MLAIVACIPEGRVCTLADLGEHLDIPPRHVAYFLATLSPPEALALPSHRVIPAAGLKPKGTRAAAIDAQQARLRAEGVLFGPAGALADPQRRVAVGSLDSGVPQQSRPASALPRERPARRRR